MSLIEKIKKTCCGCVSESKQHLDTMKESYAEHLFAAACISLRLTGAGIAVFIHALCPAFFVSTGSNMVNKLHAELQKRREEEKL